jgi:hypothetical protein
MAHETGPRDQFGGSELCFCAFSRCRSRLPVCRIRFIAPPASPCQGHNEADDASQAIEQPQMLIPTSSSCNNEGTIVMRKHSSQSLTGLGPGGRGLCRPRLWRFVLGMPSPPAPSLVARLTGRLGPSTTPWRAATQRAAPGDRKTDTRAEYRVWNDGRGTIIDMSWTSSPR